MRSPLRRLLAGCGVVGLTAAAVAGMLSTAEANDIVPYRTQFNTDVAYAGLGGLRGVGTGSISLSGVTGTVTKAELFWQGPTNGGPAVNANVSFAGSPITGVNIGTSSDNCWGFDNSQAYRADVTSLVTGNGSYAVADFVKSMPAPGPEPDGAPLPDRTPKDGEADADVNGIGLVVFFDDGNASNNRDVVLFDGNDSNISNPYDSAGWNVSLPNINYVSGSAGLDLMVGDGQHFPDGTFSANGTTLASGNVFDGESVPIADAASATGTNGGLWDQKNYDVTALMTPGSNTVALTHSYENDCLSLVLAAVNLPAGAAPNQPTTTTTESTTTVSPTFTAPPSTGTQVTATTSTSTTKPAASTTVPPRATTSLPPRTTTPPNTTVPAPRVVTTLPIVTTTPPTSSPPLLPPPLPPPAEPVVVPTGGEEETALPPAAESTPPDDVGAAAVPPASRSVLRIPSAINGSTLRFSGTLGRPCSTVSVEVEGKTLGSVAPSGTSFELAVDSQTLGVGQHDATLVCGDDGSELATAPISIVQPVNRATGAGSAVGVIAFLMLGLLALVSLPGPGNPEEMG